jgi:hypothetical protein
MHTHKWECSDTPGIFICQCKAVAYYNQTTKEKEIK